MRLANHLTLFSILILLVAWPRPGAAGPSEAEVLREGPDGFTLRVRFPEPVSTQVTVPEGETYLSVEIPGVLPGGDAGPGRPALPFKGFPFGLPHGATARIAGYRVLSTSSFQGAPPIPVPRRRWGPGDPPSLIEEYETDSRVYGSTDLFPPQVVELGPPMGWRHQRVQSVIVRPLHVAPATGSYRAIREIEIDVRFTQETTGEPGRRVPVFRDAPGWDEMQEKTLINGTSARSFRSRLLTVSAPGFIEPGATYLRVRLGATGLCRISQAELGAAGWPAGIPVHEIRVEERGYDERQADPFLITSLPRLVEDTNQNGVFDDGDFVVFYGFNYQERFDPQFVDARFSYFHTYWITHSANGGTEFRQESGYPAGTDYTPVPSFPQTVHREEIQLYRNNPPDSGEQIFPYNDAFYWLGPDVTHAELPFDVNGLAPGGNFRVRARWQGEHTAASTVEHIVALDVNEVTVLDEHHFFARQEYEFNGSPLPSDSILAEGQNTLTVRGWVGNPEVTRWTGAHFDWFEIVYDRQLVAVNDQVRFSTGDFQGKLEYAVTGFTSPEILLLDVTDPTDPFILQGQVEEAGGSYILRLRVEVVGVDERKFFAGVRPGIQGLPPSPHDLPPDLGNEPIRPGLPRDLLAEGAGSDYILITHPEFIDAWAPLAAYREGQGHTVFVCDVWEIYDQFAGGDKTPWAIQRFLAQAFRRWDPSPTYLLLGGDGSEDYRTDTKDADPDWVPTMMHFGNVPGANGLELAGTDAWYVSFLPESDSSRDVLHDMYVSRIPAGSVDEINIITQKIIRYETDFSGDVEWRNRGFFLADDQYSTGIHVASQYCWQSGESTFRTNTEAVCDSLRTLGRLNSFDCNMYLLTARLDSVETLYRNPGIDPDTGKRDCPRDPVTGANMLVQTRRYTRANVTPEVRKELSEGQVIWEFTGHGNRTTICSEHVFLNDAGTSDQDVELINNVDKPFVFMGYACHLVEFEEYREKIAGESISEELLFAPSRGAVAAMASTGYEWLHTNGVIQRRTSRNFFWDLPRDPDTGRPRRIFAEMVSRSLVSLVMEQPTYQDFVGMARTYQGFSDPALRIDISPATFRVKVDGVDLSPGERLTASSFSDSVEVTATISDDVDLSSVRVMDGDTEIPRERLTIISPPPDVNGAQPYQVSFKAVLRLGPWQQTSRSHQRYDVALEAVDWVGRSSRYAIPVILETRFTAEGDSLFPGEPNRIDADTRIRIDVVSPAPLQPSSFQFLVDEAPVQTNPKAMDETGRRWTLVADEYWGGGTHDAELRISDTQGGELSRTLGFESVTSEEALSILPRSVYFYPNPSPGPDGLFLYGLNRSAAGAQITVYSVSGRRVLRAPGPARAGTNSFRWDLRDEVGDPVANGVYLFVLEVEDFNGTKVKTGPERVALTR